MPPEVETERLLLRPFEPGDLEALWAVWTDREAMRYVRPDGWPYTREESGEFLARDVREFEERGFGQWAVVDKGGGRVIGYCGLKYFEDTRAVELVYVIDRAYWGRGLVTEAARATLRFGFEAAGLEQILALARPENVGSWRVMEKAGMRYEGRSSQAGVEHVRYALRRAEFVPGAGAYALRD